MLPGWYGNGGADALRSEGRDPEAIHAATATEEPAAVLRAHALVDAFLDRVART